MSQENVAAGVRVMDAFNRRDIDAFLQPTTADFEWFPALGMAVEGGSFRGREGVEAYFETSTRPGRRSAWSPRAFATSARASFGSVGLRGAGAAAACGSIPRWALSLTLSRTGIHGDSISRFLLS